MTQVLLVWELDLGNHGIPWQQMNTGISVTSQKSWLISHSCKFSTCQEGLIMLELLPGVCGF